MFTDSKNSHMEQITKLPIAIIKQKSNPSTTLVTGCIFSLVECKAIKPNPQILHGHDISSVILTKQDNGIYTETT